MGAGGIAYVKGLTKDKGVNWHIYRRGDKLVDPDSGATLGYMGVYLGEARGAPVRRCQPYRNHQIHAGNFHRRPFGGDQLRNRR